MRNTEGKPSNSEFGGEKKKEREKKKRKKILSYNSAP